MNDKKYNIAHSIIFFTTGNARNQTIRKKNSIQITQMNTIFMILTKDAKAKNKSTHGKPS
jgi:hypothetical protein